MFNTLTLRDFAEQMENGLGGWVIILDVTGDNYEYRDGRYFIVNPDNLIDILNGVCSFNEEDGEGDEGLNAEEKELGKFGNYYVEEISAVARDELPTHVLDENSWIATNKYAKALLQIAVVKAD